MSLRKIAIMIDGGFLLKKLTKVTSLNSEQLSPQIIPKVIRIICRRHISHLTDCDHNKWIQHAYRIFYYDAFPYEGISHHPIRNVSIDFGKSEEAKFRRTLFDELRKSRKVALRLGKVIKDSDWSPRTEKIKKILPTKALIESLNIDELEGQTNLPLNLDQVEQIRSLKRRWAEISEDEIKLGLRQKGVDMRIGIDISSISLKKQADTIILIAGDSDFVPAAKLARREGVEFILDSLGQSINEDLFEHIDGLNNVSVKSKQDYRNLLDRDEEDD